MLSAPPMVARARSLAVGARHEAAVGRGGRFWRRSASSTLPAVIADVVGPAVVAGAGTRG